MRELIIYGIQQAVAARKARLEAEARQAGYAQPILPPVLPEKAAVAPQRPDAQAYAVTPRAAAPKSTAHDREEARAQVRPSGPLSGLFEDGNSLLRAVVAAELLGPPIALGENPLWQIRRPKEPST
jgi:hypothetical protein